MKKIGLLTRERIVEDLKAQMTDTQGCFFVNFNKVKAFSMNSLRNNLKSCGGRISVAKNSLFKRALSDLKWEECADLLEAETGLVCVGQGDIVKVCKMLTDFVNDNDEVLEIKGGLVDNKKITRKEVKALASLPSREVLLGMAVSTLAAPLSGFLNCLNQVILKFVWVIKEVKKKKSAEK